MPACFELGPLRSAKLSLLEPEESRPLRRLVSRDGGFAVYYHSIRSLPMALGSFCIECDVGQCCPVPVIVGREGCQREADSRVAALILGKELIEERDC